MPFLRQSRLLPYHRCELAHKKRIHGIRAYLSALCSLCPSIGLTLRSPKVRGAWSPQWRERKRCSKDCFMTTKTKSVPKKIYLQVCPEHGVSCDEITWCVDRINDTDVEYVLPDRAAQLQREAVTPIPAATIATCPDCGANITYCTECEKHVTPLP